MKKYVCDPCGYIYDPELGDRTAVLLPVQRLRIFLRIGYVRSAELARICFL